MRYAIVSDIHNETAALVKVIKHAQAEAVDGFYCLGDVGVDDCVKLIREVGAPTVFGNWEVSNWRYLQPENQAWALQLPPIRKFERFWLTHAGPFWPPRLATLSDLQANPHLIPGARMFPYLHIEQEELWQCLAALSEAKCSVMFHGHTHRQVIWRFGANNQLRRSVGPGDITVATGETVVVGVGSVGRPLDGRGAAYVIYDDEARQVTTIRLS